MTDGFGNSRQHADRDNIVTLPTESSVNLTADEERATREKVASYLAEKPGPDENALAIEGLRYLRLMPRDRV
jgi:hypothetical protein